MNGIHSSEDSPGNLPGPEIESVSPALAGGFFTTEPLGNPPILNIALQRALAMCSLDFKSLCKISKLRWSLLLLCPTPSIS